jgi:hypothetical protein
MPIEVVVGASLRFTIEACPAIEWILSILEDDLSGIVPGMIPDGTDVLDALAAGQLTAEDCGIAAKAAIEVAAGMRWWKAVRLIGVSVSSDSISGELVLSGVRADHVSLGAWCRATYRVLTRDQDKKGITRIDDQLDSAPSGISAAERYDPDEAADMFERAYSSQGRR